MFFRKDKEIERLQNELEQVKKELINTGELAGTYRITINEKNNEIENMKQEIRKLKTENENLVGLCKFKEQNMKCLKTHQQDTSNN